MMLKQLVRRTINALGFDLVKLNAKEYFGEDIPASSIDVYQKVKSYTMTSADRIFSLCDAVNYIQQNKIAGDVVECGVWRGGSMMAVAHTLKSLNDTSRNLYLFDTFDGMAPPTDNDVDISGVMADDLMRSSEKTENDSVWCCAGLDVVKQALATTAYPSDKIHFIQGMVENTIPEHAPNQIALLRLDTDWYESTKHEMEHLFPRLAKGGVLIIDDYGHWQGARKAVDDYIKHHDIKIFLNRIDYTGRVAIKLD